MWSTTIYMAHLRINTVIVATNTGVKVTITSIEVSGSAHHC